MLYHTLPLGTQTSSIRPPRTLRWQSRIKSRPNLQGPEMSTSHLLFDHHRDGHQFPIQPGLHGRSSDLRTPFQAARHVADSPINPFCHRV